jgi:hypothetical protein
MTTPARRTRTTTLAALALALAASLLWASSVPGQDSSPSWDPFSEISPRVEVTSLEQFLSQALRTHPEILAAESQVESAKAELTRTRFQITRELITLWNQRRAQSENVKLLEAQYHKGVGGTTTMGELIEAKGKLTEIEAQFSHLLDRTASAQSTSPATPDERKSKRLPEGPEVEVIVAKLNDRAVLEFMDTPLSDIAETLADVHDLKFLADPIVQDELVTIDMRDVPLGAGLQALEDITPGIRFVVCDYGILMTSDTSEAAATYVSANEFWREQYTKGRASAARTATTPRSATVKAANVPSKSSFADPTRRAGETPEPAPPKAKPPR